MTSVQTLKITSLLLRVNSNMSLKNNYSWKASKSCTMNTLKRWSKKEQSIINKSWASEFRVWLTQSLILGTLIKLSSMMKNLIRRQGDGASSLTWFQNLDNERRYQPLSTTFTMRNSNGRKMRFKKWLTLSQLQYKLQIIRLTRKRYTFIQ